MPTRRCAQNKRPYLILGAYFRRWTHTILPRVAEMTGIQNVRPSVNTTSVNPLRLLRRTEAAEHIQQKWGYPCSPRTLAKYAVIGGGPVFRRAGRFPLYSIPDLDDWVASKLSPPMRSTSDRASPSDRVGQSELAAYRDNDNGETSNARNGGSVA